MKIDENCGAQFAAIFVVFATFANLGQFDAISANFFDVLIGDNLFNSNFTKFQEIYEIS